MDTSATRRTYRLPQHRRIQYFQTFVRLERKTPSAENHPHEHIATIPKRPSRPLFDWHNARHSSTVFYPRHRKNKAGFVFKPGVVATIIRLVTYLDSRPYSPRSRLSVKLNAENWHGVESLRYSSRDTPLKTWLINAPVVLPLKSAISNIPSAILLLPPYSICLL